MRGNKATDYTDYKDLIRKQESVKSVKPARPFRRVCGQQLCPRQSYKVLLDHF